MGQGPVLLGRKPAGLVDFYEYAAPAPGVTARPSISVPSRKA